LGLSINREKTKVVHLQHAESLDFLGFTFRYDRDLYGSEKTYLNVMARMPPAYDWSYDAPTFNQTPLRRV